MKRASGLLMLFLLLVSWSKKGTTAPAGEVAITERGEGYGPVTEKMIGPEGGVIISDRTAIRTAVSRVLSPYADDLRQEGWNNKQENFTVLYPL